MNKSIAPQRFQIKKAAFFIIVLWLASLACNTIIRTPVDLEPAIEPTPIETPSVEVSPRDGMTLIIIPGGTFIMGTNSGGEDEWPEHEVYLDDYWIDKTEVTNSMYYLCMESGICEAPLSDGFTAPEDHYKNPQTAEFPVVYVTWYNAQAYCEWVGRRLPTEAEWEKAARGTDARIYPWGNQDPTPELLNFDQNNFGLMPVGSFPLGASPYGVMDLAGNAWEWVADWYDENYYSVSPNVNPTGPSNGPDGRALRGGAFFQSDPEVRTTNRHSTTPDYNRSVDIGFRCASDNMSVITTSR